MCTVCGLTRQEIEKGGQVFNYHIRTEHSIWKYFYYRVYLSLKDRNLLTGIEESIYQAVITDNPIEWFPRMTLSNEGASATEIRIEANIKELLEVYLEKMNQIR